MSSSFETAMKEALRLASQARGRTAPNPMVGAVVLSEQGEILGRGYHHKAGEPHAEVLAIREALISNPDLSSATLVVTLEPCNHVGRTPPCTDAIVDSRISKVVVGTLDPNPLMQGKSLKLLKEKGLQVKEGILKPEAEKLIRGFRTILEKRRPFVTIKCATTLDGKIATSSGESKWITEEPARALAHQERSEHDAIMVGVGTIVTDDPQLTVRYGHSARDLTRVILDARLRTPVSSQVFSTKGSVLIYCDLNYSQERKEELEKLGAVIIPTRTDSSGFVDFEAVFNDLVSRGVQELLIEGGAKVLGAVVGKKLFDRVVYFMSPKILGSTSRDVFEGLDVKSLHESVKLENITTRVVGSDIVIEGNRCSLG